MNKLKELQDFAIWMTGCGYDFTKHEHYLKNKHLLTDEAINYSPCCKSDSEQLKGKYPLTFAKWRESNGYTPYDNSSYQKDNKIINVDKLEIKYRAYYKTF